MMMRLFQNKSAKKGSMNGLYWNFENKGNQIHHNNNYGLITHWMPLPEPPKGAQ